MLGCKTVPPVKVGYAGGCRMMLFDTLNKRIKKYNCATKPQCKKRFEKTSSADTAAVVKWS